MKALVVYESMWGNTEQGARAIAAGLSESFSVEVIEVSSAPVHPGPEYLFLHYDTITREQEAASDHAALYATSTSTPSGAYPPRT